MTTLSRVSHISAIVSTRAEIGRRWLFGLSNPQDDRRPTRLPLLLFALLPPLYLAHQVIFSPRFVLGGEMWAEMATNYYANAESSSLRTQLLATDAGYIPLPQRIVGLVGNFLDLPPTSIPYFYTFTALILSAMVVGVIVLPAFRPVIASDVLRFLIAAACLMVIDFEVRTYINFTYLVVVPVAFLAALALVQPRRNVPAWAWLTPLFLVSKPAVLTVLPAVVAAGLLSRGRFRRIMIVSLLAGAGQVVRLALSARSGGSLLQTDADSTLIDKVWAAVIYTLGFLPRFLLGAITPFPIEWLPLIGLGLLALVFACVLGLRSRAGALVLVGVSLVAATMLLNAVSFPNWFVPDGSFLSLGGYDRRVIVAVFGAIVIVGGIVSQIVEARPVRSLIATLLAATRHSWNEAGVPTTIRTVSVAVFVVWFVATGWGTYASRISQPLTAPLGDVLQWQEVAPELTTADPVVCIPVAPFGWPAYGRGCQMLYGSVTAGVGMKPVPQERNGLYVLDLDIPDEVADRSVAAIALIAQAADVTGDVDAKLVLTRSDGDETVISADEDLPPAGGTVFFASRPAVLTADVMSARVEFTAPVRVGWVATADGEQEVKALWMGQ
ncbi:hypothetical protein ACFSBZ_13950 [Amnibacterium flavum]|nr:hypothetical protein [Amnibacterium flavum]